MIEARFSKYCLGGKEWLICPRNQGWSCPTILLVNNFPNPLKSIPKNFLLVFASSLLAALLSVGFVSADGSSEWMEKLKDLWGWLQTNSKEHAFFLLAAIAILPGFGVPSSPFLILCGALSDKTGSLLLACLLTAAALWVNALWMFLFAAYPGRRIIKKFLERFSRKMPDLPQSQGMQLAVILRVTPGVPLTLQNYLLGVSGISLRNYLLVSMPVLALWAMGFVVFGEGLLEGNAKLLLVGVGLLIILIICARMIAKRYGVSKQ